MELRDRESNRLEAKVARAFHKNIVLKKIYLIYLWLWGGPHFRWGNFTGGVLIQGLRQRFQFYPGDVTIFRSCLMEHYILPFKVKRGTKLKSESCRRIYRVP